MVEKVLLQGEALLLPGSLQTSPLAIPWVQTLQAVQSDRLGALVAPCFVLLYPCGCISPQEAAPYPVEQPSRLANQTA
jgi:hypothetical protein